MQTIKASEFKAKCLKLMDQVAQSGHSLTITKNGVPVAKLVPVTPMPTHVFGLHRGLIDISGDIESPVDVDWDAAV